MTDAEISRRLALAIGWPMANCSAAGLRALVSETGNMWYGFDYRDPTVIWPIAERFECFPKRTPWEIPTNWSAFFDDSCESGRTKYVEADTATKAVALAVIKAHEGAKE